MNESAIEKRNDKFAAFMKNAVDWQQLARPDATIAEYRSFLESEFDEFQKAKTYGQKSLELADYIWVGAILVSLYNKDRQFAVANELHNGLKEWRKGYSEAFEAVCIANYSKIMESKAEAVKTAESINSDPDSKYRNAIVAEVGKDGGRWVVLADDFRDQGNPQLNKIMKPIGFQSASSVLMGIYEAIKLKTKWTNH